MIYQYRIFSYSVELVIEARGHPNIKANHKSTWQLTKESEISPRADCIIGVQSSYSCSSLPHWLKKKIRDCSKLSVSLTAGGSKFTGYFEGHPQLKLSDETDIVIRKSEFISERTGGIRCNFSAKDLPEQMRIALQDPNVTLRVEIKVVE